MQHADLALQSAPLSCAGSRRFGYASGAVLIGAAHPHAQRKELRTLFTTSRLLCIQAFALMSGCHAPCMQALQVRNGPAQGQKCW